MGFMIGLLIFGKPWQLLPAWGDIPTWISAIATTGLLIGAIITAKYAIKAFRAQSKEVGDQATMFKVQSDQLEEQRTINALQAKDLEESLKERERLRRVTEREQADAVLFEWWPASQVMTTGLWCAACPNRGPSGDSGLQPTLPGVARAPGCRCLRVTCGG